MGMKIILARHGETVENATGIIMGQIPGRLSERGLKQAEALAMRLGTKKFDRAFCSDLKRCVDTAAVIMRHHPGIPIEYTESLREINFGDFQGQQKSKVDWDSVEGSVLARRAPHGESGIEMRTRVVSFINELLRQYPDETILLVTHNGPIKTIIACIEGIDPVEAISISYDNAVSREYTINHDLAVTAESR